MAAITTVVEVGVHGRYRVWRGEGPTWRFLKRKEVNMVHHGKRKLHTQFS